MLLHDVELYDLNFKQILFSYCFRLLKKKCNDLFYLSLVY